jgi:ubiquinone/menaquinone biosynthesis C-methylase UbiE
MDERTLHAIQKSYDGVADEYARHLYSELDNKPLDRELLTRFAARVKGKGAICDMGCGPGHIARFLHNQDRGANRNDNDANSNGNIEIFGLDLSPRMIEEARRLNPEISFRQGNMLALDLPDTSLAGIAAFYAIVNLPRQALPRSFGRWHAS